MTHPSLHWTLVTSKPFAVHSKDRKSSMAEQRLEHTNRLPFP